MNMHTATWNTHASSWSVGFDVDGCLYRANHEFRNCGEFQCSQCLQQWPIFDGFEPCGDAMRDLRRALGSLDAVTREPVGDLWAKMAKGKNPSMTRVRFFSLALSDVLQNVGLRHAVEFCSHTLRGRPGAKRLLRAIHQAGGQTPLISNGVDRLMLPLLRRHFGDVLRNPLYHANRLKGSGKRGYRVEGLDGDIGVLKERVVGEYPNMVAYCGDTAFGDGPAAKLIHERGGLVFCVGENGPDSLWAYMQNLFPNSPQVFYIDDFTQVFSIIQNSDVRLKMAS